MVRTVYYILLIYFFFTYSHTPSLLHYMSPLGLLTKTYVQEM